MLSLTKMMHATKAVLNPRLAASFQSAKAPLSIKHPDASVDVPAKPKKPLTPFFRFLKEERPKLVIANPNLAMVDSVREVAKKWSVVDDSTKKKLNEEFKKEQVEYLKKRTVYENNLTEEQKYDIQMAKQELEHKKEKRAYKKKLRELEKPKKPASGFLRYLRDYHAQGKEPGKSWEHYRDMQKDVVKKWAELTDDQKLTYQNAYKADSVKYREELSKWEMKMIESGNVEFVRQETLIEAPPRPITRKVNGRPKKD